MLIVITVLIASCMPDPPSNPRAEPPPNCDAAIDLAHQLVTLAIDRPLPDPPPVFWYEGACLEGYSGCRLGLGRMARSAYRIDLVTYPDSYGSLAHEMLHWGLWADGDADRGHDDPSWRYVEEITATVDALHPANQ